MPDFHSPIGSGPTSPEDRYRQFMNDFSEQKEEKIADPKEEIVQKTTFSFINEFANQLKDTLGLAAKAKERRMLFLQRDGIRQELQALRKMLRFLVEVDESYNPEFILQISIVWNHVIDNYSFLKIVDIHKAVNITLLHSLIENFENYPEGSDFSLAYYMMHFPGKRWHPFPLMEIFRHLHEEAKNDLNSSTLHKWVTLLDEIIPSV